MIRLFGLVCLSFNYFDFMAVQYTSIKPLGDRVLVKIKTVEEKTDGGIFLPSTAQTKPQAGEVVAVGEGKTVGKTKLDISVKVVFKIGLSFLVSVLFIYDFHSFTCCFVCVAWDPGHLFEVCRD